MGWYILFVIDCLLMIILVPKSEWRRLYPAGLVSVLVLIPIELVFTNLGGFSYMQSIINLHKVPIVYLLCAFPGGVLVAYYYPVKKWLRTPYVLFISATLLLIEIIILQVGYMKHGNWNIFKSFALDIYGFIVVLWLSEQLGAIGRRRKIL